MENIFLLIVLLMNILLSVVYLLITLDMKMIIVVVITAVLLPSFYPIIFVAFSLVEVSIRFLKKSFILHSTGFSPSLKTKEGCMLQAKKKVWMFFLIVYLGSLILMALLSSQEYNYVYFMTYNGTCQYFVVYVLNVTLQFTFQMLLCNLHPKCYFVV